MKSPDTKARFVKRLLLGYIVVTVATITLGGIYYAAHSARTH